MRALAYRGRERAAVVADGKPLTGRVGCDENRDALLLLRRLRCAAVDWAPSPVNALRALERNRRSLIYHSFLAFVGRGFFVGFRSVNSKLLGPKTQRLTRARTLSCSIEKTSRPPLVVLSVFSLFSLRFPLFQRVLALNSHCAALTIALLSTRGRAKLPPPCRDGE